MPICVFFLHSRKCMYYIRTYLTKICYKPHKLINVFLEPHNSFIEPYTHFYRASGNKNWPWNVLQSACQALSLFSHPPSRLAEVSVSRDRILVQKELQLWRMRKWTIPSPQPQNHKASIQYIIFQGPVVVWFKIREPKSPNQLGIPFATVFQ